MYRVNHREPAQGAQFVDLVVHMEVGDYNDAEGVWYPKLDGESVSRRRARFYLDLPEGTTFGEARRLWNKLK